MEKVILVPPKNVEPQPGLVERTDVAIQAAVQLATPTFIVDAVVYAADIQITEIRRKAGGEIWPMRERELVEYSSICAELFDRAAPLRRQFKEFL